MATTKDKLKEAIGELYDEGRDILLAELMKEQPSAPKTSTTKKGASKTKKETEEKEVEETPSAP